MNSSFPFPMSVRFVSNINLELQEVQSLLFDLGSASNYDVACKWLRDNRARRESGNIFLWAGWNPSQMSRRNSVFLFGLVKGGSLQAGDV